MAEIEKIEEDLDLYRHATECKIDKVNVFLDNHENLELITQDQEKLLRSLVDKMEKQYQHYENLWLKHHESIFEMEEKFPISDDESVYVRLSDEVEETQLMVGRLSQYVDHF